MTLEIVAGVYIALAIVAAVYWRQRNRVSTAVLVCQLGELARAFRRAQESGARGLKHARFGDGYTQRRIIDRRWIRTTSVEDDQVNMYFIINGEMRDSVRRARRTVLGVEYYDRCGRDDACTEFTVQFHNAIELEASAAAEKFTANDCWKVAYFDLTGIIPDRGLPRGAGGADFRIHLSDRTPANQANNLEVRRVYVLCLHNAES